MQTSSWCAPLRCGAVTGLRAEARIAEPLGMVAAGGGWPAGAEAAAERLVAAGATALVSFGLCGGLAPGATGIVVPRRVLVAYASANPLPQGEGAATRPPVKGGGRGEGWAANAELSGLLGPATHESLLAGHNIARTAAEKAALFAATGASAIDLESGAVAAVAARHGLPFAVLRAVCDPAEFDLPPAALLALDAQGGIRPWRVAGSIAAEPRQIPALLALGRAAAAARAALIRRVAEVVRRSRGVL